MTRISFLKGLFLAILILLISFLLSCVYRTSCYYNAYEQDAQTLIHSGENYYSLYEKKSSNACPLPKYVDTNCFNLKLMTGCFKIGDINVKKNETGKVIVRCPYHSGYGRWVLVDLNNPAKIVEDSALHSESKFELPEGHYRLLFVGRLFSGRINIYSSDNTLNTLETE